MKILIVLVSCTSILLLLACTGAPPLSETEVKKEQKTLDSLFLKIKREIQIADAESVFAALSEDSQEWFINIRNAANSESVNFLVSRPFFEILAILSLRVESRLHPEKSDDPVSILNRTIINVPSIRNNFTKYPTGPFTVYQDRAEVGLKKAPQVPVFYFIKEGGIWKMNLIRTMPVILLGIEGIARNFKNEPIEQAIYVIETFMGYKILPEDLRG